jgi:diadenosine tetraphosphate (Ap4A) HIT family hydrolase
MAIIYETENFIIESHEKPEVDRLEGGHIKIGSKIEIEDRTKLTAQQAIELMRLTMVVGESLVKMMASIGVEIGRINYQDNGNWKPSLHIHLYGRAKNAVMQKFGDPIVPGHKNEYKPLTDNDIKILKKEIETKFKEENYSDRVWGLK